MMATPKAIENSQRLRYIRALERFSKSIISFFLNTPELTKDSYDKKIDNALKILNRIQEANLYKGDLQDLQKLVKKMVEYKDSVEDILDIKDDILKISNHLEKSKNAKRYKKDKHQNAKFDEWD